MPGVDKTIEEKIMGREELAALCERRRADDMRLVFTNGCFDLLHAGHVLLLEKARKCGDVLVVGLNSDSSVRRLKGATRPVNDQESRALALATVSAVSAVCIFDEDTPVSLIRELRPHVHVKGGDYQREALPEAETVREVGGQIVIVPLLEGHSTTQLIEAVMAESSLKRTSAI